MRQVSGQGLVRSIRRTASQWSPKVGLGTQMAVIVIIGILALLGLFAYLGTTALNESNERMLQERRVLAQTTARHIDYVLSNIEDVLTYTAAQPAWRDVHRRDENLADAFQRLNVYGTRVFLLDSAGQMVSAYPPITSEIAFDQYASIQAALKGRAFAVSRFLRTLDDFSSSTLATAPLRDANGQVNGVLVVSIDLTKPKLRTFTQPIGLGATGYIDLIDLNGTILASTRGERIGMQSDHRETLSTLIRERRQTVSACHDCHTPTSSAFPIREVLAFAPLEHAQWGVTVHQSEEEVFGSIRQLQTRIFVMMAILLAGALVLVYLTARRVITPIQALTAATKRIAAGDLTTPLEIHGQDEIGALAQSFDAMRARLKDLIVEIQTWNRDLDARVNERTVAVEKAKAEILELYQELQHKEQIRRELLNRVFTTQEEERKRISRELHDETCQVLTGLAYALDDAAGITESAELKSQLERMHTLANTAVEEIQRIILDLRPTMLDHLGLIPALRWYAETRLNETKMSFTLREHGSVCRLSPQIETALFRVVQEAINNIARHSHAKRVELDLYFRPPRLRVTIADDGQGFVIDQVLDQPSSVRGLGLLGMCERMDAIGGQLVLRSVPGWGTLVELTAPFDHPDLISEERM
ncbi:MAG: HAMP domain-containing protein [Chloroflexi bacterium]|nr:HAMP domain-containing protein [Chloroflexota bacterium]